MHAREEWGFVVAPHVGAVQILSALGHPHRQAAADRSLPGHSTQCAAEHTLRYARQQFFPGAVENSAGEAVSLAAAAGPGDAALTLRKSSSLPLACVVMLLLRLH
jgi:hypothetical protein